MDELCDIIGSIEQYKALIKEEYNVDPSGLILGVDLYEEIKAGVNKYISYKTANTFAEYASASMCGIPVEVDYVHKRRCSMTIDIPITKGVHHD